MFTQIQIHFFLLPSTTKPLQNLCDRYKRRLSICALCCREKVELAETGQAAMKLIAIDNAL